MPTLVASAICEPLVPTGQNNRAGQNFEFVNLPSDGNTLITATISNAFIWNDQVEDEPVDHAGVELWQNNATLWIDSKIAPLSNGGTFPASKVSSKNQYYLGNPSAGTNGMLIYNLVVTFSY